MSWTEGSLGHKDLGARTAVVWPLTYGRARLVIGPTGSPFYDDAW